jgi:hypothetical protein
MRDYKQEAKYHAQPDQVKKRVARNKARRQAIKDGKVSVGDGKEIDHKNMNPLDNSPGNLRVVKKSVNRKKQPKTKTQKNY